MELKPLDWPHQTVFLTLDNSSNKLSQNMWCHVVVYLDKAIDDHVWLVHGRWFTEPSSMKQSACWAFEIFTEDGSVERLRKEVKGIVLGFLPEEVTWSVAQPEILTPSGERSS